MERKVKFEDAQKLKKQHPQTFYAPEPEELSRIRPGDFVKVCAYRERFWAEVISIKDGTITARIDNDLLTQWLRYNDIIKFKAEHVHNISPLAERKKGIRQSGKKPVAGKAKKKGRGLK